MSIKKSSRNALGRGLSALVSKAATPVAIREDHIKEENKGDSSSAENLSHLRAVPDITSPPPAAEGVRTIAIDQIEPNPAQPRKVFTELELKELADSIKNMGVLQPVIVRPASGAATFQIVAGERRWRAAKQAGLLSIPAIVKELSDWESLEIALVENVQRQNLNPIDEAEAYQSLMDQFSLSQSDVAERIGKDRATIANFVRLLKLENSVQQLVRADKLSMGHAKALLAVKDSAAQYRLAKKVVDEGLSVRAVETLVANTAVFDGDTKPAMQGRGVGISGAKSERSAFPELVDRLRKTLATKVAIRHQPSGRGKVEIDYFSEEELDRIVDLIIN